MKKLIAIILLCAAATFSGCGSGWENEAYLPDGRRRCQAITQEGHQCKRAAEDGIDYCWQHK